MKKIFLIVVSVLVSVMLAGCGSNKAYKMVYRYDPNEIASGYNAKLVQEIVKQLDEKDGEAFRTALSVSGKGAGFNVDGRTVGEILDDYKKWSEKVEKERKEAEEAKKRLRSELATMVTAVVTNKYNRGNEFDPVVGFKIAFTCNAEKTVRAFEGVFRVNNVYGERICNLSYSSPTNLQFKMDTRATTNVEWELNPFDEDDLKLRKSRIEDLKINWVTEKILFTDGSMKKK